MISIALLYALNVIQRSAEDILPESHDKFAAQQRALNKHIERMKKSHLRFFYIASGLLHHAEEKLSPDSELRRA